MKSSAVLKANCFAAKHAKQAAQWDNEKNAPLTPADILPKSNRKFWWLCPKSHSYEMSAAKRANGVSCPYCAGKRVSREMSLGARFSDLVSTWHPSKNGNLTPFEVMPGSAKKVWWRCENGHEWQASPLTRKYGHGCPRCAHHKSGHRIDILAAVNPTLAEQWHPTQNGALTPHSVTGGSGRKAWWRCARGHEWQARVYARHALGNGCPDCSGIGTSVLEIRVYSELKALFGDVKWRGKVHGIEIDLLLPEFNVAVEIDGYIWHKDREWKDLEKAAVARKHGIKLIRLRQTPLKQIEPWDVAYSPSEPELRVLHRLVDVLSDQCSDGELAVRVADYKRQRVLLADASFRKLVANLPTPPEEESLAHAFPKISKEWNYEKNAPLTPEMFLPFSDKKVWWTCEASGHEYEARIAKRSTGRGCPICSKHPVDGKVAPQNSLAVLRPDVAALWDTDRNFALTPRDVAPGSRVLVWWKCPACGISWQTSSSQRTRKKARPTCPTCSTSQQGQRIRATKLLRSGSLAEKAPEVARSWHPTRNAPLTPNQVSPGSNTKAWWLCLKKPSHEWKTEICSRVSGRGCPYCAGKKVSEDNSVAALRPDVAAMWDHESNGLLTPAKVTPGSGTRVWWRCKCGAIWQSTVSDRTRADAKPYCPICSQRKKGAAIRVARHRKYLRIDANGLERDELFQP